MGGVLGRGTITNKEFQRLIRANDRQFNSRFGYADNVIKTSKYSVWTFLPLNLFEQFQRLANLYFLLLMVLQIVGMQVISSLTPVTTALPLIGVLSLTAAKDVYDEFQRHKSDRRVNGRLAAVVVDGRLTMERWASVRVGDIIRMDDDRFVPADVLLLSTSEPNGLCFIETSELDGETNLKSRQCLAETTSLGQSDTSLGNFNGEIICEAPNNKLNKFQGTLIWNNNRYLLDNDRVVLRGCVLRNTEWCYGVVLFAGRDTKLMQNSGKTNFKITTIDRLLNQVIILIVLCFLVVCVISSTLCLYWESTFGEKFQIYLPWTEFLGIKPQAVVIAITIFLSYAIVLNTFVPISLYVSVELIRFLQSFFINWDEKMYSHERNIAAKARTTTLNEELGQIKYIFSDKTGTLTQNIMTFNKCSIAGKCYGDVFDGMTGEVINDFNKMPEKLDFSFNRHYEENFCFYDPSLLKDVRSHIKEVHTFFTLLAVCHTVMPDSRNGILQYQAQSPDEAALVSAARNFGFVFKNRTPNSITVEIMGEKREYEVLCILDFNNVRKRMSVILRQGRSLRLYCKGADSVLYQRLRPGNEALKAKTLHHLTRFAGDGLRTLCLAVKDLEENEFEAWKMRHHEASLTIEDREEKLHDVYEEMEKDMTLIGVTAVEDKLQDGVQQTIANLIRAQIRIWVLTGDKQETAINVGYSCELLNDDMELMVVDADSSGEVVKQLIKCQQTIQSGYHFTGLHNNSAMTFSDVTFSEYDKPILHADHDSTDYALVVNGHSLVHALNRDVEHVFVNISTRCKAVICCRVTPLQKAMVVELIKKYRNAVTLAIGDGANDVSMIKVANIGVGISGEEGNQAMLASDYAIGQFRFLERLLLVHGRWSYYRMGKFLRYFLYKNFTFTLCHFWFAFSCGYSAQTLFDEMFISFYNLFYTSLPVLALGVLDQDVDERHSLLYPRLYTPGHINLFFNRREFFLCVVHGFYSSAILYLIPKTAYQNAVSSKGRSVSDYLQLSSVVACILVVNVTFQVAFDTSYWTVLNIHAIWISLAVYLVLDFFLMYFKTGYYPLYIAMQQPIFWLTMVMTVAVLMVPMMAFRFLFTDVYPTLAHRVHLKQRLTSHRIRDDQISMTSSSVCKHRPSIRSGYAFSHQEGFGRLITSGKLIRRVVSRVQGNSSKPKPGPSLHTLRHGLEEVDGLPSISPVYLP